MQVGRRLSSAATMKEMSDSLLFQSGLGTQITRASGETVSRGRGG